MLIILGLAVAVTLLKIYLVKNYGPPPDPNPTFIPRPQVIKRWGKNKDGVKNYIGLIFDCMRISTKRK